MNISNSLRSQFVFCSAAATPFPDTHGYLEYADDAPSYDDFFRVEPTTGKGVLLNTWRVDYAAFGTRFFAVPQFLLPIAPARVELHIPDQIDWPAELWSVLDARDSVHLSGKQVRNLGIARHLCRALDHWSHSIPEFEHQFRNLPFGSRIVVSRIDPDVTNMEIKFACNERLSNRMLSIDVLRDMWRLEADELPPSLDYTQLRYVDQLASEVSLVHVIGDEDDSKLMIFKSQVSSFTSLYHELKVMLTLPRNPNIVERPSHLITTQVPGDGAPRVCGFILRYYAGGTLEQVLPQRREKGTLTLTKQLDWAIDIVRAVKHVSSVPGSFYSDLRMDNVVVADDNGGREIAVLIDLEQSRNIYNWAPPEIYYLEWIAELGAEDFMRADNLSAETVNRYARILKGYLASRGQPQPLKGAPIVYNNAPHGWYFPWLLETPSEREASQVYLLGKALWCIFEGVGDADIVLGRSHRGESEQRFPEFRRTPEAMRELIRDCTIGAREWKDGHIKIYRRGGQIFPLGLTGLNGEREGTLEETLSTIQNFWQIEISKAEKFVEAQRKYNLGEATGDDLTQLDLLRRPRLDEVLSRLDQFSVEQTGGEQ